MYNNECFDSLLAAYKNGIILNIDFIDQLLLFEENSSKLDDERKFLVYLNLGKFICLESNEQNRALDFNKEAETLMSEILYKYAADLFHDQGHIYARMGDYLKSKEAFVKYVYYQHKDGSKIDQLSPFNTFNSRVIKFEKSLYSFRPVSKYLLYDLINQEITLANPIEFNDPFDPLLFKFLEFRREKIKEKSDYDSISLSDAYKHIRIRCFVTDKTENDITKLAFKNNLMWAHYADSYKGICIRYRFDDNPIKSQIPEKEFYNWHDVKYPDKLHFKDKGSADTGLLFATKNEVWKDENEVRLIHFNADCNDKFTHLPLSRLGGKIEAIFFGIKCLDKDIKTIKSILGTDVEYFEFNQKVISDTQIDNLELINPEVFDKLNKETKIGFKLS